MIVVKQPIKSVTQDCCVLLLGRFPCVHLLQQSIGKIHMDLHCALNETRSLSLNCHSNALMCTCILLLIRLLIQVHDVFLKPPKMYLK